MYLIKEKTMVRKYDSVQLQNMIKKAYSWELIQYIQDLEDRVMDLENKNYHLKNEAELKDLTITDQQKKLNSVDYRFGSALQEWMSSKIKKEVEEHLHVNVEGYYEEYSGQRDHYHEATVSWN